MQAHFVSVYRSADGSDCTKRGVTSRFNDLLLLTPQDEGGGFDTVHGTDRALLLLDKSLPGYRKAVPCDEDGKKLPGMWCFGGNFIYTSDSRFQRLNGGYPIPVHDRNDA